MLTQTSRMLRPTTSDIFSRSVHDEIGSVLVALGVVTYFVSFLFLYDQKTTFIIWVCCPLATPSQTIFVLISLKQKIYKKNLIFRLPQSPLMPYLCTQ
jgi:hypothetical protein